MSPPNQNEELQRLCEQVAELTRRVYQLELQSGSRTISAAASPPLEPQSQAVPPGLPAAAPVAPELLASLRQQATEKRPERSSSGASLESRIGGQWLNRVGIVAVLVGLSHFLKLAFENDWIGPATQVIIGLLAGLGLLLWSERFRAKGYSGFAYSLKAIAIGALYLSLWAASQYYHLAPPTVTFFGMVMVTMTSAALSLRQNSELLGAFALVGGFLTPVLVSTGQNHVIALFCYVALLDLGTTWMVAIKNWRRLLAGSFGGTLLLFAAWSVRYYSPDQLITTLCFASFFFLLYAVAPLLGGAASREHRPVLVAVALLNAGAYFSATYVMLEPADRLPLVWLNLAAATVSVVLMRRLRPREPAKSRLFAPLYLAIATGFLTATIPIQFGGQWLALGWLVEAGALFWAAHRSRSLLLRIMGVVTTALGVAHLVAVDSAAPQPPIMNSRFGLYLAAIAALALLARNALAEGGERNRQWASAAIVALNLLALVALHCEVMDYFAPEPGQRLSAADWRSLHTARDFTYSAVWMIYGSGLMLVGFWKRSAFLRWQAIVLLSLTAAKVFVYDISALERGYRIAAFIVLGAILLAVSFFYQRSRLRAAE